MKLKCEPVAVGGVVIAVIAVAGSFGLPGKVAGALTGLVTAVVALFVRQAVTPVPKAVEAATAAATSAATKTVEQLDSSTIGPVGQVTNAAANVVAGVTSQVGKDVVQLLGGKS